MNQEIAFSSRTNTEDAVLDIFNQLRSPAENYKVVIFFASSIYDFDLLSKKIKEHFPSSHVIGTSTSGEISPKGFSKNTLVVTTMSDSMTRISGVLIDDADKFPVIYKKDIEDAASSIGIRFHSKGTNKDCFALTFINGLCNAEEAVLALINSIIDDKEFNIVGGSAGDDLKFKETYVSYNGEVVSHGAVILFFKTSHRFIIKKENIFVPTGKRLKITSVVSQTRTITSINNQNPKRSYATALGLSESEAENSILKYPFGRVFGTEMFISSISSFQQNGNMNMYSRVLPNTEVEVLEPIDPIEEAKKTASEIRNEIKNPGFTLIVNCILRTIGFEKDNMLNPISRVWNQYYPNYCGFSSYGEQINRLNSNQTFVVLVIEA
ncbi:MAG: FIST C-terminal domain-containing protein [Treponema sp.]|nr:FIST C-terminal domain-containing protein [Treponema sp.]